MTVLWEKYVALSVETSFFQSLFFSNIKKTQYESHPIFPFSDGFHKLELCIGLNPFFFVLLFFCFTLGYFVTFSWVHTFAFLVYGVIRYVLGGPSSLSVFFLPFSFVDFTISVFSPFVNTLFWFFICFPFLFCLLLRNYFYFQIIIYKWANIEKCTKSVADRTLFTDIKLLYTFYCPYTADSIVQFFKFAHL